MKIILRYLNRNINSYESQSYQWKNVYQTDRHSIEH